MAQWSSTLPVASTQATLTPVRRPGSKPMVAFGPAGAANNRSFKFLANTSIAPCSEVSRTRPNKSVSIWVNNLIRQVQRHTSINHLSAGRDWSSKPNCSATIMAPVPPVRGSSSGITRDNDSTPSLRPRNIANARWLGTLLMFSSCSK